MLIFVILSTTTTTTTAAYFSKLPQPQLRPYSYQHHSRAPLCRQSPPHTTTVLCSSPLPPCPSLKLRLRLPLRPLCRPRTCHPIIPSYPVFCPPSLPCPPSISCPLLCPQLPLSSPGPPSISPPQHYDNIRPSFAKPEPYLDGIFESYQSSYKGQLSDDNYLTHDTENITDLQHSSFPEKSTTNTTYHSSSSVTSNVTNSKSTILFPSYQQFNYPSDVYLSNIVHENASALSQQLPQIATTGEDRLTAGITQKYETKYLIKSNCSLNGTNCAVDHFFMPPENDCCTNCSIPCRFRYIRRISLTTDQLQEVDPVCNNERLRQIIDEQADDDINKSKLRIQRTARWIFGGLFGVICGNDNFAYIIYTKDFCQYRKGNVTCYAFRSLLDYSKTNIP